MPATVRHRNNCRMCLSENVEQVVDLMPIPLSEQYTDDPQKGKNAPRYPIDVYMCADCGHVQQLDVIDSENLWDSYTYYSGDAKGMPEHFEQMAVKFIDKATPDEGDLVIDIGSNDGSLLKPFKKRGYRVLGIDPATEAAQRANDDGIPTIVDLMSVDVARKIREQHGAASIICAFNVFAHADDLGEMADCIRILLADDGLFFFEAQYLIDILDGLLIATIFHEHMSHHSVKPLIPFLEKHGLELVGAAREKIQHGSLIGTVQLKGGPRKVDESVGELVALETGRKADKLETMRDFNERVKKLKANTTKLADQLKSEGKSIAAYGAARSGPTLISQLGLTGSIEYILDDHPQKVGKYSSGDGIEIVPTAELLSRMPDYVVILAWVHSAKIIENNQGYLKQGGHFLVICPETRIVGEEGATFV